MYPLDFLSERADVWKQSTHSFVQSLAISSKVWVIERAGNTKAYTNLLERVQGSTNVSHNLQSLFGIYTGLLCGVVGLSRFFGVIDPGGGCSNQKRDC